MMNRLQFQPTIDSLSTGTKALNFCAGGVIYPATGDDTHAVFAPLHYEPNYGYPLVVWLHGAGDSEQQLRRVMPFISLRNYVSVAPRGTRIVPRIGRPDRGYDWQQAGEHIEEAHDRIQCAIAAAHRRFNVRSDRVFLVGHECGGTMAYRIGMRRPSEFAGILSLGGPFPTHGAPLAELNAARQLSLFVAACRQSGYYPTEQVCNDLRLFHCAGMSITLREYPGEDGLTPQMLADVDRWIMDQIASPPALADVTPPRQTGVE
jgi:phospholipase/carboxylesterase